jgi:hypothetical protein
LQVIKEFTCKNTLERHLIGSTYHSEDPKRLEELKEKGYLEGEVPKKRKK